MIPPTPLALVELKNYIKLSKTGLQRNKFVSGYVVRIVTRSINRCDVGLHAMPL